MCAPVCVSECISERSSDVENSQNGIGNDVKLPFLCLITPYGSNTHTKERNAIDFYVYFPFPAKAIQMFFRIL